MPLQNTYDCEILPAASLRPLSVLSTSTTVVPDPFGSHANRQTRFVQSKLENPASEFSRSILLAAPVPLMRAVEPDSVVRLHERDECDRYPLV